MHDRRLEVGVSFDPTRGYFTTAASCPGASPRCRWAACAGTSRPRCCPTSPSSTCGSTAPRGSSATGGAVAAR